MLEKYLLGLILRNLIILFFRLLFILFFGGGKLLYNVLLVYAEQQNISEL